VDAEIDRLLANNIIRPINYSKWAAPIVVVKKSNGEIRLCADFSTGLNENLEMHQYPLPIIEDILTSLNGAKWFSQLDLADAYLQLEVEESSKELLTIHTHRGLFQYNRLPFGVKVAPGIFQQAMDQMLVGIDGVVAYLDDIIITGSNVDEHDRRLKTVLQRICDWGFHLKLEKCSFRLQQIEFLGFVISDKGVGTDPKKVTAIDKMPVPSDVASLRAFLGLVNYYGKFVPDLHTLKKPLEDLLHADRNWSWTSSCELAVKKIKDIIMSPLLLAHYNPRYGLVVAADASSTGVGAVLLQRYPDGSQKAIIHASKSLSKTQRHYGQIEKEAYALVFAVERFHKFLWGRRFTLWTDHKPLLAIFGAKKGIPSTTANRLQRWAITMLGYDFHIEHKSTNEFGEADALSRLIAEQATPEDNYVVATIASEPFEHEIYNVVRDQATNLPVSLEEIKSTTAAEQNLQNVRAYILNGWPTESLKEAVTPFFRLRQSLSIVDGCILNGDRIVIPQCLRNRVLNHLHAGHPGIQRMKALARSYVYWPNIDNDIEKWVKGCRPCVDTAKLPIKTHLQSWLKETRPWVRIHADYAGPINGYYYLVVVDAYSKWPEVFPTRSITTKATISLFRQLFCRYGAPEVLVTDNGTSFTSVDFATYCATLGVTHLRSPPYHPQSNGQAERFVDTIKRGLQKFQGEEAEGALQEILYAYRYTPCQSIPEQKSPAEAFLGRKLRNVLDLLKPLSSAPTQQQPRQRDHQMEQQFNRHHGTRSRQFHIGDTVWILRKPGTPPAAGFIIGKRGHVLYEIRVGRDIYQRHANQISKRLRPIVSTNTAIIEPSVSTTSPTVNPPRYPSRTISAPQRYF
jgi:transposase InsO family protein